MDPNYIHEKSAGELNIDVNVSKTLAAYLKTNKAADSPAMLSQRTALFALPSSLSIKSAPTYVTRPINATKATCFNPVLAVIII